MVRRKAYIIKLRITPDRSNRVADLVRLRVVVDEGFGITKTSIISGTTPIPSGRTVTVEVIEEDLPPADPQKQA